MVLFELEKGLFDAAGAKVADHVRATAAGRPPENNRIRALASHG